MKKQSSEYKLEAPRMKFKVINVKRISKIIEIQKQNILNTSSKENMTFLNTMKSTMDSVSNNKFDNICNDSLNIEITNTQHLFRDFYYVMEKNLELEDDEKKNL